jgi:hypothetical protein
VLNKFYIVGLISLGLIACSGETSNKTSTNDVFNHESLTIDQFSKLAKIPERAEQRRNEAYATFSTRSSMADYLLGNDLKDDLNITRRLVDTKSRIVLDAYFNGFLKNAITEEALIEYFSGNVEKFSEMTYVLSYYLIRMKPGKHEENLISKADALYEKLSAAGNSSLNLGEYSAVASSVNVELSTNNADPAILMALEDVSVGEYSRPAKTKAGVQIFKIVSQESMPVEFEAVKSKIEYKLKQDLKQKEYARLSLLIAK